MLFELAETKARLHQVIVGLALICCRSYRGVGGNPSLRHASGRYKLLMRGGMRLARYPVTAPSYVIPYDGPSSYHSIDFTSRWYDVIPDRRFSLVVTYRQTYVDPTRLLILSSDR